MNPTGMNWATNRTVVVHLYGMKEHYVTFDDLQMSCQALCEDLLRSNHPQEAIGPAALQLFGLAYFDDRQKTCIWINPCKVLSEISPDWPGEKIKLHLRMRFVPSADKINSNLLLNPNDPRPINDTSFINYLVKYLYYQVKDDFITGRLEHYFDKSVPSSKARGIAVLDLLLLARLNDLSRPDKIFDFLLEEDETWQSEKSCPALARFKLPCQDFSLKKILPKKERKNIWRDYKLKNNMRTKLTEYSNEYSSETVSCQDLMVQYIKEIMADVTEKYIAKDSSEKVTEVTIDIPHGFSLFTREKSDRSVQHKVCTIPELRSVNIQKLLTGQNKFVWVVHVHRTTGTPLYLRFDSAETAESFVSGLDGYYRMIHDYYFSLCDGGLVEPPSLKMLNQIRSHGPIEDNYAVKKLKGKGYTDENYLIKQDIYNPDQFAVVYSNHGQIRIRQILTNNYGYYIEGKEECCCTDLKGLLAKLIKEANILHPNPFRVKPRLECCEVLRNLFVSDSNTLICEDEDSAVTRKRQPLVYLPTDLIPVKELEKLGNGYFTEVCKRRVKGMDNLVAVKQVRSHLEHLKLQEFSCYESLQEGVCTQLAMDDVPLFVRIYGICLTSTPQVIEEYAQFGSLSNFFMMDKPVTHQHFLYIALQLSEALLHMDEKHLHHGNICCHNIMVFQYDSGNISIKLADSGMLHIYNKLPLAHLLNSQRIPWLAPELFSDLTKTTIASDVYAFSTTLWECVNLGVNPMDVHPLKDMQHNQLREFFEKGKKIDFPPELAEKDIEKVKKEGYELDIECVQRINKLNSTVKRIMSDCWSPVETRMDTSTILRELRAELDGYSHCQDSSYYYSRIQYLDQTSLRSCEDQAHLTHHTMAEIPNILSHLDGGAELGGHVTADRMVVDIPQMKPKEIIARTLKTDICRTQPDPKSLIGFHFLIDSSRIKLDDKVLGSGHYGEVRLGHLFNSADRTKSIKIVAKTLKESQYKSVLESEEFRKEGHIMSQLKHDNIVRFIGISNNNLIMEWIEMGCMRDYLKKRKREKKLLRLHELLEICKDISSGMRYLVSNRILHCDLAARNVLLTKKLQAKISDFGLSKILDKDKDYYRRSSNKSLPAWWCSIEALKFRKFTHKADVWSYGVVMWEALTHCESPRICDNAKDILHTMENGKRLNKPNDCPDKVYQLMLDCWKSAVDERPDFPTVEKRCSELVYMHKPKSEQLPSKSESDNTSLEGETICAHTDVNNTQGTPISKQQQGDAAMNTTLEGETICVHTGVNNTQGTPIPKQKQGDTAMNRSSPSTTNVNSPAGLSMTEHLGALPAVPISLFIGKEKIVYRDEDCIGKGNFGQVFKGKWKNKDNKEVDVAIKKFEKHCDETVAEVSILISLDHPGIVKLYGYCRTEALMVMELVENGDMLSYLQRRQRENNPVDRKHMIGFCLGIAEGMEYLSSKHIIHCDLAGRNILLTKELQTKISDFGLSKFLIEKAYYKRSASKPMNLNWCSPEFFKTRKLSTESDVWSFGIVMWEIFSHGKDPNPCQTGDVTMNQIAEFVLEKGCTLERTTGCPEDVFSLMQDCWKTEPKNRPKFSDLVKKFKSYFSN